MFACFCLLCWLLSFSLAYVAVFDVFSLCLFACLLALAFFLACSCLLALAFALAPALAFALALVLARALALQVSALRVLPAETRLTVYRQRLILGSRPKKPYCGRNWSGTVRLG